MGDAKRDVADTLAKLERIYAEAVDQFEQNHNKNRDRYLNIAFKAVKARHAVMLAAGLLPKKKPPHDERGITG